MTITKEKKLEAHDVLRLLENHYNPPNRQPSWNLLPEIQAPRSNRRADLIAMSLGDSNGHHLVGHEIKVSRADVVNELKDHTKPDPWLRYCQQWWLVVSDPVLVEGLDIPERWGIMAPPSGRRTRSMTVLREAPKVKVDDPGDAYRVIASRSYWRSRNREQQYRYTQQDNQHLRQENADLRRTLEQKQYEARALRPEEKWAIDLAKAVQQLNMRRDVYGLSRFPTPDEAAQALSDLSAARLKVERLENQAQRHLEDLKQARNRLSQYIGIAEHPEED